MNRIVIEDVKVIDNHLECNYTIYGEWKRYFKDTNTFFIDYGKKIDRAPESVLVIPLLCNVLPLVWIFDAELIVDDIDKDFFDSIEDFKQGYVNMYPQVSFKGRVSPMKITDNRQDNLNRTATFFSGGVDAYNTLFTHIDENPILVTLWGADITFEDQVGWKFVDSLIKRVALQYKLDYIPIKTSFRRFLNEKTLSDYVFKLTGDNWWYGYQHGIGIIGHIAPLAYQYKIKTAYIASSLTIDDNTTCASDPTIDNFVRFFGCQVVHDGYEYSRPEKTLRISKYVEKTKIPVQFKVCWESEGGSNCCHCEKCYRTILCLIAVKSNPLEYGFIYREDEFAGMMNDFRVKLHFLDNSYFVVYKNIQDLMHKNYTIDDLHPSLRWFYKSNLDKNQFFKRRIIYRFIRKGKNILRTFKKGK
ncbi:MAG: hypothetical protein EWM47_02460 [Anaerolineaceae bacterium]|nr:MAG: hypothetical protein EWM47_02460 [Anaerolineaceae bacterium]